MTYILPISIQIEDGNQNNELSLIEIDVPVRCLYECPSAIFSSECRI